MRPENLCIFCMHEKNNPYEVCSRCGHRNEEYVKGKDHLPPFTVLNGKFLLGRSIGEGGFAIAYIAMDLYLETVVAIKELFPFGYVTRDASGFTRRKDTGLPTEGDIVDASRRKFIQEARTLARMRDMLKGGVVNVIEYFEEMGTAYMVMEYLDGTDLKVYLSGAKKLSTEQVLDMMKPVIVSLKQIHDAGIIHRDISPDNIMLLRNGEIKLLDFGGVRDTYSDEKSLMLIMKNGYSPIEQYQAQGNIGPWTDVYALCATMYRCLTGVRLPEPVKRASGTLEPPSTYGATLSPQAERTLMKGLEIYPSNRLQNMQQLYDGLYGDMQVPVPVPHPEPEPEPESGSTWLYKIAMGMAGVAIVALCAVGVFAAYRQFGSNDRGGIRQAALEEKQTESAIVILDQSEEQTSAELSVETPATEALAEESGIMIMEPATEAPVTEAPTEAPVTEAPTEAPVTEAPTEAPVTEAPAAETPVTEMPAAEQPAEVSAGTPAAEQPAELPVDAPGTQLPVAEEVPAAELPNEATLLYASGVNTADLRAVMPDQTGGSSYIEGGEYDYRPYRCMDGDDVSSWQTEDYAMLLADFNAPKNVKAIKFRVGNWRSEDYYWQNCRPRTLYVNIGEESHIVAFPDEMQEFILMLDRPVQTNEVTFSIADIYAGTQTDDICITEITIYEGM